MSLFANPPGDTDEGTRKYVRALLELLGDRDPLDVLSQLVAGIEAITAGLDDATLRKPEREGKWSMVEVVQHLADAELVVGFRYRLIVAHDTPAIPAYDQEAFADRLHYAAAPLEEALDQLRAIRRANLRLLRSLSDEERKRGGIHAERGFEDVNRLMQLHAAHDLVHTGQLERVKKAVQR